jgi:prepilin-type N-terminal cleavage/methylation domain-containing protein
MNKLLPQTNKKGFTLIELLVVIAIIAILAIVGIAVFSGQQQSARDARRRADIQAIAQALEANKVPNSAAYQALASSQFANGIIPIDNGNGANLPHYSVCYSTSTATPATGTTYNPPSTWGATVPNPTAATANCTGGGWVDIGATAPSASATSWTLCARLETGTNNFYCRSNGQ